MLEPAEVFAEHRGVGMNGSRVELVWIQGNVSAHIHPERGAGPPGPGGDQTSPPSLCGAHFLIAMFCGFAVEQGNQGLASGRRLDRIAGHDLPRAYRLIVKALVRVAVRVERGAVE